MTLKTTYADGVDYWHDADANATNTQVNQNTAAIAANAPKINGVLMTNTPSVGQVPTAINSLTASWQAPGGGGGTASAGLPLFDSYVDWSTKSNGAVPATDDAGKAIVVAYTVTPPIISGGKLVSNDTGTSAQATHVVTNPNGSNPILYYEIDFDYAASGSSSTGPVTTVLWESAISAGVINAAAERSPAHVVWNQNGFIYQTIDVGPTISTVASIAYPTNLATGTKYTASVALDTANNRAIIRDPLGTIHVIYTDGTAPVASQNFIKNVPGKYFDAEIFLTNPSTDHRGEFLAARVSCLVNEKFDIVYSKWQRLIDTASAASAVQYCAPPTGSATIDTANLQAAHDALPTTGGEVRMQPGIYYLTAAGITLTKKTKLIGCGSSDDSTQGLTVLVCTLQNATGITVNVQGCVLEDFSLVNTYLSAPHASGAGLNMLKAHNAKMSRLFFFNWYDNVAITAGHYWTMNDCINYSPVRYGVRINDTDHNDSGDNVVHGCWFDNVGVTRNPAAALRWETASGLRLTDCKFNGSNATYKFITHIDINFDAPLTAVLNSADIFIQNCSIENPITNGILVAVNASSAYSLYQVHVQNNEFMACPTGVQIGRAVINWIISGNTFLGGTTGINILANAGAGCVGLNHTNFTTTPLAIAAGASPFIHITPPLVTADGIILTDNSGGLAQIDHRYARAVDFTVNATPAALWTFSLANKTSGRITATATGTHNAATGFAYVLDIFFLVDGAGTVTTSTISALTNGAAQPTLSTATAANKLTLKLATSDANNVTGGKVDLTASGLLTQVKRGA